MNNNGKQARVLKIHSNDNVGVALVDLKQGDTIQELDLSFTLTENIPAKHKFSLTGFNEGENIIMYGVIVGKTTKPISKGSLITIQNVQHATGSWQLKHRDAKWLKPDVKQWEHKQFMGYHRADGSV